LSGSKGFTLIELMIGMVVSAIVISMVTFIYIHIQASSAQQVEIASIQQNVRGALAIMERELRMAGQDFTQSFSFGVTDVRSFTITEPGTEAIPDASGAGWPILRMTLDLDNDGVLDLNETVTYSLYDKDGDGDLFDLGRSTTFSGADVVSNRQFLAEGIEAIGLAYAFDNDDDGEIDRAGAGNDIIWAVDSNNDGLLDADLLLAGLGYTVLPEKIRAVQIWILARARHSDPKYVNTHQYSVGTLPFTPNDSFRRWLLTEVIHCRNL
jgi:type IV pilus assembly protein PilW